ncbi:MAG: DUF72 domain-containing protein [Planctomycetota bacterium]
MIRIGPAGWTHPELARVWPASRSAAFDPLAFLGSYFGCIEVDATEEVVPRKEHVARWAASLADNTRTRLCVRTPRILVELSRPDDERRRAAESVREALAPLQRRDRLGAVVASLPDDVLHGPAEVRALGSLARVLAPLPLVLAARHRSWYETRALDALTGVGWSLAHLDLDDLWDAPPARHRPTGPIGMLRLLRPGVAERSHVTAIARRAKDIANDVDAVYVIADNGGRGSAPAAASLTAALALKVALAGEGRVRAWPEIVAASPGLASLVVTDDTRSADRA